jgi:hypothetical protein
MKRVCACVFLCFLIPAATAHASVTTRLRPTTTLSSSTPWSTVGASTSWEALDDSVTPSDTPTSADYISANVSHSEGKQTEIAGFSKITGLAGASGISATAWFYTPTTTSVELLVRNSSHSVLSKVFTGSGWHSVSFPVAQRLLELGQLSLRFNSGTTSGLRQIYAAFIEVNYQPASATTYWGADMDGDVRLLNEPPEEPGGDAPWDSRTWNEFEADAGAKKVSIVHFSQPPPWRHQFEPAPLEFTMNRGAIPLISMGTTGATLSELAYSPISSSASLQKFREWTDTVHDFGHPFFLRLDWEMNLISAEEFQWVNEARSSPSTFVAAWRRLHAIAEEQEATNITWVWCPNVSFPGSTSLKSLFPGRPYVDWTCMDGYNRDSANWASFADVFSTTYNEILALTDSSSVPPMMIGETASVESGLTGKARWIAEALGTEIPSLFPKLKAFLWFNWNIYDKTIEARRDWPIESSSASQESFANAISSPFYAEGTFGSLPLLKPVQPLP